MTRDVNVDQSETSETLELLDRIAGLQETIRGLQSELDSVTETQARLQRQLQDLEVGYRETETALDMRNEELQLDLEMAKEEASRTRAAYDVVSGVVFELVEYPDATIDRVLQQTIDEAVSVLGSNVVLRAFLEKLIDKSASTGNASVLENLLEHRQILRVTYPELEGHLAENLVRVGNLPLLQSFFRVLPIHPEKVLGKALFFASCETAPTSIVQYLLTEAWRGTDQKLIDFEKAIKHYRVSPKTRRASETLQNLPRYLEFFRLIKQIVDSGVPISEVRCLRFQTFDEAKKTNRRV